MDSRTKRNLASARSAARDVSDIGSPQSRFINKTSFADPIKRYIATKDIDGILEQNSTAHQRGRSAVVCVLSVVFTRVLLTKRHFLRLEKTLHFNPQHR